MFTQNSGNVSFNMSRSSSHKSKMEKSKSKKVYEPIIELLSSSDEDCTKPDPQQEVRKRDFCMFSDDDGLISPHPSLEVSQPTQRGLLGQTGIFSNSLSTSYENSQRSCGQIRSLVRKQLSSSFSREVQFSNATQEMSKLYALSNTSSNSRSQIPNYKTEVSSFPPLLAQLTPVNGFPSTSSSTASSSLQNSNYNGGVTAFHTLGQPTQMLGFPSVTQVRMKSVLEIQLEGLETVFTTQSAKLSVDSTSSIKNGKKAEKPSGIPWSATDQMFDITYKVGKFSWLI